MVGGGDDLAGFSPFPFYPTTRGAFRPYLYTYFSCLIEPASISSLHENKLEDETQWYLQQ